MPSWLNHRTATASQVPSLRDGKKVKLLGWVESKRAHGAKVFLMLRDYSGVVQLVADKSVAPELVAQLEGVNQESAVAVEGEVRHDPRAPHGAEVVLTKLTIVAPSEPWPITKSTFKSPSFLFDKRHLSLRGPRSRAIMRVRHEVIVGAHEFFTERGFVHINAPTFITSACEGGATLFKVNYFGREVYLTQSAQLYEEAAIAAFEKVYTIQPSFRAEKSRTRKHLTEFWHIEAEVAFATHEDIMKLEEELVRYLIERVLSRCGEELSVLKVKDLEPPKLPLERITYDEAVEIVRSKGLQMKWGEDLGEDEEKALSAEFSEPFFVTDFPLSTRAFYHMPDPENPKVTLSSDMYAPAGYGEITTGGQRISDYDTLLKRIKDEGLPAESYDWYLEIRRYGLPPHAGFGMGLERFLRWILRLDHVRQATLFPRTVARIHP